MESDVIGDLLSERGEDGSDTEENRWGKESRHPNGVGSGCADGGKVVF